MCHLVSSSHFLTLCGANVLALFEGLEMGESGIRFSPVLLSAPLSQRLGRSFLASSLSRSDSQKERQKEKEGVGGGGGSGTERITAFPH